MKRGAQLGNLCGIGNVNNLRHGHACRNIRGNKGTREYYSWQSMIQRCTNSNVRQFLDYGGRGITVCERWRRFENFLADMGLRPEGKSLGRLDNDKGYSPENCKWQTVKEQCANRRPPRNTARRIIFKLAKLQAASIW